MPANPNNQLSRWDEPPSLVAVWNLENTDSSYYPQDLGECITYVLHSSIGEITGYEGYREEQLSFATEIARQLYSPGVDAAAALEAYQNEPPSENHVRLRLVS